MSGIPAPPPAAHVKVFRAARPDYVAVFVEGPDDVETLTPWLKHRPYPAGGCTAVRVAVAALRLAGESGFVGIVDGDCLRLEGIDHSASDLIVTEAHDLEGDLLHTPALTRLLAPVAPDKLASLTGNAPLREALTERALPFGLLRWYFFRRGMPFAGGRLSPNRFLDEATWSLDTQGLMDEAAKVAELPVGQLQEQIAGLAACNRSPREICNGHDLLAILTAALRGPLGSKSSFPQVTAVGTALRLAVDPAHRDTLRVWRDLLGWQDRNSPWIACAV